MRVILLFAAVLGSIVQGLSVPTMGGQKRCATNIECLREREAIAAANPVRILRDPVQRKARAVRASATRTEPMPTSTSAASEPATISSFLSTSTSSGATASSSASDTSFSTSPVVSSLSTSSAPPAGPTGRLFTNTGNTIVSLPAGRYDLAAWGAQGGGGRGTGGAFLPGGSAANYNVSVMLDATYDLNVVVGGRGGDEPSQNARSGGGGGGGGSFLYTTSGIPLVIAGGGGGESSLSGIPQRVQIADA